MRSAAILHPDDRIGAPKHQMRRLARGETTATGLLLRASARQPKRAAIIALATIVSGMVIGNLVLFQPEQHRAPMFVGNPVVHDTPKASAALPPPARPVQFEREAPAARNGELLRDIQRELIRRGFLRGEPDPTAIAATARAIRDFQTEAGLPVNGLATEQLLQTLTASNVRVKDQIVGLLKGTGDRFERPETVAAMQRALNRLNYGPLKDDGQFGPATRAALERFEKDRKLPSRTDAPQRVLRELAQASGVAID